jgi:hypothetical protein
MILDTVASIKMSFPILITNEMLHHLLTGSSNHIGLMDGLLKGPLGLGKVKVDDLKVPLERCFLGSVSDLGEVIPHTNTVLAMMALRGYPLGAVQFLEEAIKEINPIPAEVAEFLKEDDALMIEVLRRCVRLFGLYQYPPFDPVVEGRLAQSDSPEVDQITTFYTDGLGG